MKNLNEYLENFKETLIKLQLLNYKKIPISAFTSFEEIDKYTSKHKCSLVFNGDYLEIAYE